MEYLTKEKINFVKLNEEEYLQGISNLYDYKIINRKKLDELKKLFKTYPVYLVDKTECYIQSYEFFLNVNGDLSSCKELDRLFDKLGHVGSYGKYLLLTFLSG